MLFCACSKEAILPPGSENSFLGEGWKHLVIFMCKTEIYTHDINSVYSFIVEVVVIRKKILRKYPLGVWFLVINWCKTILLQTEWYKVTHQSHHSFCGPGVWAQLSWVPKKTTIKASTKAGSSENLPEEGSTSRLTWLLVTLRFLQALGLGTTVSSWLSSRITLSSLLHGCPLWEAHDTEPCFFKTSKGECPLARQLL